jgi:uncharacterized protein
MSNIINIYLIMLIRIYQKTLSPFLSKKGVKCKFFPSCSEYCILAIEKYGLIKGIQKFYFRWIKCRPDNFDSFIDYP